MGYGPLADLPRVVVVRRGLVASGLWDKVREREERRKVARLRVEVANGDRVGTSGIDARARNERALGGIPRKERSPSLDKVAKEGRDARRDSSCSGIP